MEDERYQLDVVVLISTHNTGSTTKLLKKSWTLFSGVTQDGRFGETHKPPLSAAVLEFSLQNKRVASL